MIRLQTVSAALLVALGLAAGGFFPGYYYYKTHFSNRSVTVKGLSEMNVCADLAVWNIQFQATADSLKIGREKMQASLQSIETFLKTHGFSDEEIVVNRLDTNDLNANLYRDKKEGQERFILSQTVVVRSHQVDAVAEGVRQIGALIGEGVVFKEEYGSPASYLFTKLNEVKPKMLEEATKNARMAADEFAKNSESKVGKIRRASQGVFSILPREAVPNVNETEQINKTIRVVSTVEYFLD